MANGKEATWETEHPHVEVWEDGARNRFALELVFRGPLPGTGRVECVAMTLRSIPRDEMPAPGQDPLAGDAKPARVLASHLRELRLDEKVARVKRQLATVLQQAAAAPLAEWEKADDPAGRMARRVRLAHQESAAAWAPKRRKAKRRARVTVDDDLLREVARVYIAAAGIDTGQTVARHFGRPRSTTDKWIGRARRRGFLSTEASKEGNR